jgi:hypothetical protein
LKEACCLGSLLSPSMSINAGEKIHCTAACKANREQTVQWT